MNETTEGSTVEALLAEEYGIVGTLSRLSGENDNFLVVEPTGRRHVLKLCGDEQTPEVIQLEHLAAEAVASAGLDLAFPRVVPTRDDRIESCHGPIRGRLLRFVSGIPWGEATAATRARRVHLGRCIAGITTALESFDHPAAARTHAWDLTAAADHRKHLAWVDDAGRRRILETAYLTFVASALPILGRLPRSLVHGDLNDENVLVSQDRVCGVLDFGDCLVNPTICELAIALAYLLFDEPDPLAAGAEIVAGYHAVRPLTAPELEVLFPLICGRLAASLAIAASRRQVDPDRSAWFVTEERAWRALEQYVGIDPIAAADQLAAGTGVPVFSERTAQRDEMLQRRSRHFCGALSLSYREPLKMGRGSGQFLFDERERAYLDLYNNVCHVGHCHPRVVAAGARQMARLNTNSRYLYDELVEYGERLCATLPRQLQSCFFVNSGSEANELALRLARTHTGRQDLLVVDGAYHGHTSTLIDISPYKFMGKGGEGRAKDWVHVVPVADGYRGAFKGQGRETGVAYGEEVGQIIASSARPIAGFITESLLSCGGQVIPPAGYFETAFDRVREAGGVCIVDEVQVGFGRVGSHFWAFERQNVVPDIVVMGKPIGNGHPMSAVVTTEAIAESFSRAGMEFFATFGGNPVSCAIGMAVLDVIRDEGLQENALAVGSRLRDGLKGLIDRHPLIGDVRGAGLFIGLELVRDRETLEPAREEAAWLVNELRQHRILTGTDGPFQNVIKIKPPMVMTAGDADMVVRRVDDLLTSGDTSAWSSGV